MEKAIEVAAKAHGRKPKRDKGGAPYILHPLRVMMAVETPVQRIVAVLHDVLEDTPVTADDLRDDGFSETAIAAVDALTKRKGESRITAARRALQNPIARAVKLGDLNDNMDLRRIARPTKKDFKRHREYARVRRLLEGRRRAELKSVNASAARRRKKV